MKNNEYITTILIAFHKMEKFQQQKKKPSLKQKIEKKNGTETVTPILLIF